MSDITQSRIPEQSLTDKESNRVETPAFDTTRQTHTLNGRTEAQTAPLSQEEASEPRECEMTISRGWTTLLEVGRALARIRTKRLYRGTHATFEEYCREKFQFSKTHANRLIGAVEVAEVLAPVGVKIQNEFQARHLVGLAPEKILAAGLKAAELAGTSDLTAGHIRKAVSEIGGGPAKANARKGSQNKQTWAVTRKQALNLIAVAEKAAKGQNIKGVLKALDTLRDCLQEA